jgi:purine nucleoside phosphorylase
MAHQPTQAPAPHSAGALDAAVEALAQVADADRRCRAPRALLALGTGVDLLPERLDHAGVLPLDEAARESGVELEDLWSEVALFTGSLAGLDVWIFEDPSADHPVDPGRPAWGRALPLWLGAKCGARALIHVTAAAALREDWHPGQWVAATDHVNLSGQSPLTGLGPSRLGPLFPDQTRLHDRELRGALHTGASERGLELAEGIIACTAGPSLDTPADREYQRRSGADLVAQGLAWPLLAASHAGLPVLSLAAISEGVDERVDLRRLLERSEAWAPELEELLLAAAPEWARVIDAWCAAEEEA